MLQNFKIANFEQLARYNPHVFWFNRTVFQVTGRDAKDFLHRLSTNDILQLAASQGCWTVFVNAKARIINVALVIAFESDRFLIIGDPATGDSFRRWLRQNVFIEQLRIEEVTNYWKIGVAVLPHSLSALPATLDTLVEQYATVSTLWCTETSIALPYFPLAGQHTVLCIGESSEIVRLNGQSLPSWQYHYRRVMTGIGDYGTEWQSEFHPLEVGLKGMVSFEKGCYIGQEVILRIESYGKLQRQLVGVESTKPISAGQVLYLDDRPAGKITSVVSVPSAGRWVGLAVVRREVYQQRSQNTSGPWIEQGLECVSLPAIEQWPQY